MPENETTKLDMEATLKEIAVRIEALELAFSSCLRLASESICYASEKNKSVAVLADYVMKRMKAEPMMGGKLNHDVLIKIGALLKELDKYAEKKKP